MLTCTNAIESMISVARTTMRNVKHWTGRGDEKTLGGRRHARSPAVVPECPGLQADADAGGCPPPPGGGPGQGQESNQAVAA